MIQLLRKPQLFENLHRRGERAGCLLDPVGQRPFGERTAEQILEHLAKALHRQQLVLRQIHRQRPHSRPILGRSLHGVRKGADRAMLTAGADPFFHLMLRDLQPQNGQVMDLPPFFEPSQSLLPTRTGKLRSDWADGSPPDRGSPPMLTCVRHGLAAHPLACCSLPASFLCV